MSAGGPSRFERLLGDLEALVREEGRAIDEENWDYGEDVVARKGEIIGSLIAAGQPLKEAGRLGPDSVRRLSAAMEACEANARRMGEKRDVLDARRRQTRGGRGRLRKFSNTYQTGRTGHAPQTAYRA